MTMTSSGVSLRSSNGKNLFGFAKGQIRKMAVNVSVQSTSSLELLYPETTIVELDPWRDSRWETFVLGHPDATIYHHPAWLKVLER